jgi:hypothetical protein
MCNHPRELNKEASMPDTPAPLTASDFIASGYEALLQPHHDATCHELHGVLWKAAEAALASGHDRSAYALRLLSAICSMRLVPGDKKIYRAMIEWDDGNLDIGPDKLSDAHHDSLAAIALQVPHAVLRGRIADLIWLRARRRGVQFPRAAIDAYCTVPIDRESWLEEAGACWHRALQLAVQIRSQERITAIEQRLVDAFMAAREAPDLEPLGYLKPLARERRPITQAGDVAADLAALGQRRLDARNGFHAEPFFEAAAEWYERFGDEAQRARMLFLAADAIVAQADAGDSGMVRHHWYTKAIGAYRRVAGPYREALGVDAAIEATRRKLGKAGHQMMGEMTRIQLPREDVADEARAASAHVKERPPFDALLAFCGLDTPVEQAPMEAAAARRLGASVMRSLVDTTIVSGDGRQVDRRQADNPMALAAEVRALFVEHAERRAIARIAPALRQLRLDQAYTPDDFFVIAQRSPIVPAERARMLGQGLYAGYCGDMVEALHILLPQFEHLVRQLLKEADSFTTHHNADGNELEVGLSKLLERKEMEGAFGYGLTLAIDALMCDRAGPNLRNDVAHGLAAPEVFESAAALYTWWLILQLVVETCAASSEVQGRSITADHSG